MDEEAIYNKALEIWCDIRKFNHTHYIKFEYLD